MPLTDVQCRNAVPRDKVYKLHDSDGLYLEVPPTGNRRWRFKYRMFGKEKRISLGIYPITSLLKARQKRDKAKENVENYIDPSDVKKEKKRLAKFAASQTFELVAREWHTRQERSWTPGHAKDILQRLERDVFPEIGSCAVGNLTAPDVLACIQKIEERKRFDLARRVLQNINQVMRYAKNTGRIKVVLSSDLSDELVKHKGGHYRSIEVDELPDLVKAIRTNDTRVFSQTKLAIRLMLLTFQRTSELLKAEWKEFDLDKGKWHIPAERIKKDIAHFVPLSRQAIEILQELREKFGDKGFVFPSPVKKNKHVSETTILNGLKLLNYRDRITGELINCHDKMTGHGFRSLALTTIKEKLDYDHEIVDRQLAHKLKSKVDQAYDRTTYLPERIEMMQKWADYLDTL